MIYICKGCGSAITAICNGFGHACSGCARCIDQGCDGLSKCLSASCGCVGRAIGDACKGIATFLLFVASPICKPLGGYVFISVLFGAWGLVTAILALVGTPKQSGEEKTALVVLTTLDVVHIAFAIYIQWRLVTKISEDQGARNLTQQAGRIVLYDVGFCLYSVVFVASGYYAAQQMLSNVDAIKFCGILLVAYQALSAMYGVSWSCMVICCGAADAALGFVKTGSARKSQPEHDEMPASVQLTETTRAQWKDDLNCALCSARLGKRYFNPRHHCRVCARSVCRKCSPDTVELAGQGQQRACTTCAAKIASGSV